MKKVALVGGSPFSVGEANKSDADEFWVVDRVRRLNLVDRIDRLFEIHKLWIYSNTTQGDYQDMRDFWDWLHKDRPYPVYMHSYCPQIPKCIRYPIEEITSDVFHGLYRGDDPHSVYTSSFDYMMAMAIHEQVSVIEPYGFEMMVGTEWACQREGAHGMIMLAIGRGIEVRLPKNSRLMRTGYYAYDRGVQMIFRRELESQLASHIQKKEARLGRMNRLEGELFQMSRNGTSEKELEKMNKELLDAKDAFERTVGACVAIDNLIKHVDMEEHDFETEEKLRLYDRKV